jgi:ubiquinone/menaquinone biosynthesis C-methylase UbiE
LTIILSQIILIVHGWAVFGTALNTIYFWNPIDNYIKEIKRVLNNNGMLFLGFSPKSIMEKKPFINDYFKLFEAEDIIKLLKKNQFVNVQESRQIYSKISVDGNKSDSIDICLSAVKS